MAEYKKDEIREKFKDFFEDEEYHSELIKVADNYPDEKSIFITYNDLTLFFEDLEFPRFVVRKPKLCLDEAEKAIKEVLGESYQDVHIHLRLIDLTGSKEKMIRDLRSRDLSSYLAISGLVRKTTEVRPKISTALFRCSRCGENTRKKQSGSDIEEPTQCAKCGKSANQTNFTLLREESEFRNFQNIEIQESPDELRGGEQPQRLKGWVKNDLVGQVSPGDRITLNGILDGKPKRKSSRSKSRVFDIYMRVNGIEVKEYEFEDLELNEEDREEIEEAAEDPRIFAKIVNSIAPSIHGLRTEKIGLALQMFSGVRKEMPDGSITRGDIHILLVGDPGTAKSQLLRYIAGLSPRGMYASGKGSTGAGLTAAAIREDIMGESQWVLEAGTLVLADGGIACVDELDKMRDEDRSAMHEAMEQQTISVAKAGINATLNSRCAVLGAANPEYGRFETHENISQQINLPPPLISRFDLIFALIDKPDKKKDAEIADHILNLHEEGERIEKEGADIEKEFEPELDKEFLRKYIAHAKSMTPIMTDQAMKKLEDFYLDLRSQGSGDTIPATARQLESLVRLSEASARAHLREQATVEDAERAISVTKYFLEQVASTEGDTLDIDIVASSVSASERTVLAQIRDIIKEKRGVHEGGVPADDILEEAVTRGLSREEVRKELDRMKTNGQIYEPSQDSYDLA
ncbi:MAG: minichromosome maintenance protein MCM [Candidatus Thermoplasmatota archaeon]|nr:minichromosome maintenance protein MCM [Candidatus Thermoplasmatota archaeon]